MPFTQGMELFVALSRNDKEAYLFNYRGERHFLINYANQLDWTDRTQQFFDHFLRDAPAPAWFELQISSNAEP